jgi:hypothetical protein
MESLAGTESTEGKGGQMEYRSIVKIGKDSEIESFNIIPLGISLYLLIFLFGYHL